jgi:hypothetical protein
MRAGGGRGSGHEAGAPDRLRAVLDAVLEALDQGLDERALAVRAMLSPFHINRLFGSAIAQILTVSLIRRQTVQDVLRELGSETSRSAIPSSASGRWRHDRRRLAERARRAGQGRVA